MATTTFKFDEKTSKILEELKTHYGATSKAEIIRKAIGLLALAEQVENEGKKLMIKSGDQEAELHIT